MAYSKRRSSTKRGSKSRRRSRRSSAKSIKAASIKHLIVMPMKAGGGKRLKKTRRRKH